MKNSLNLTTDQINALAFLVTTSRPEWSQLGTRNALLDANAPDLASLAFAALRAAADPEVRTPQGITFSDRYRSAEPAPRETVDYWQPEPKPDIASPETVTAKCAALRTHLATRTPVPNCHCQPTCSHADCGCATTHHQKGQPHA